MQILDNFLYILIEGEPESPEVAFIDRVIGNLINQGLLSNINYRVVEIGGSGNFNSIAKLIYQKSKLHQSIPVIGISDRDFRTQDRIDRGLAKQDHQLIKYESAKIICWGRHEWENFLLEETEIIANLLNQIPSKSLISKPFRRNTTNSLTKIQLDEWLIQYFQKSIFEELFECLKFRFRETANLQRLNLDKPKCKLLSLVDIEIWFKNQIGSKAKESRINIFSLKSMFQDIVQENFWQSCIHDPSQLDVQQAKIFFRGKEALEHLRKEAIKFLAIENLQEEIFKQAVLQASEKNTNSLIVQELRLMLQSYFEQAANLTEI
ncbi:hypothetical protein H6F47_07295 [Sphaerospermopsis sp. FACHB-1094]|uniref:hypothetical protein n=1 Tax=Sphaerospermopsis sp. FACHB-1094 TaxID=2692861 RepID=UPI0016855BF9|nr:hypothetical protein [Sphaerospermopsis sp. FACHB-1094]MBD2132245.1 hypothetical protein [Sphaerospermopsis sp. FACHB-1094]